MNEGKDKLIIPEPEKEECEIFRLFPQDKRFEALEGYVRRCLDYVIEDLGKTNNPRDHDMALKGLKAAFEHIIELPKTAERILKPEKKEEVPNELSR